MTRLVTIKTSPRRSRGQVAPILWYTTLTRRFLDLPQITLLDFGYNIQDLLVVFVLKQWEDEVAKLITGLIKLPSQRLKDLAIICLFFMLGIVGCVL